MKYPLVVTLKKPRPRWWRFKKRREWEKKRAVMQAIVDYTYTAEVEEDTIRAMTEAMLYGQATLKRTRKP